MYMSIVPFKNHPDLLMNDWTISPEIVETAIKQFFLPFYLHFKSDFHQTYTVVRYAYVFSSFRKTARFGHA